MLLVYETHVKSKLWKLFTHTSTRYKAASLTKGV